MNEYVLYLTFAGLLGISIFQIAWMCRTKLTYLLISLYVLTFIGSAWQMSFLRGQPKLISTEFRKVDVAEVLWYKIAPHDKVFILLTWKGLKEPLYYSIPWDADLEKQMNQAHTKATAHNTPMMIRNPFDLKKKPGTTGDGESGTGKGKAQGGGTTSQGGGEEENFYAAPPPPEPAKDVVPQNSDSI
jgi:hypothetical protein